MRHFISCLSLAILLGLVVANAQAQSSNITYQGRLLKSDGTPVSDGTQSVIFKIYDGSGTMVWTETQSVTTKSGIFDAKLGAATALPSPFPANAELEVAIGGVALTPRT